MSRAHVQRITLGLGFTIVVSHMAFADEPQSVAQRYDILGTWSADCTTGAKIGKSKYYLDASGRLFSAPTAPNGSSRLYEVIDAQSLTSSKFRLKSRIISEGGRLLSDEQHIEGTVVLEREGESLRSVDAVITENGNTQVTVRDGISLANSKPMPKMSRCLE